jgi:2-(1,2-epoxy-1,2-dihydrophenyl)acetyl-CoA isomerase
MIDLEIADGIATITLNRPDRMNALSDAMLLQLLSALEAVTDDASARAVVVTGAGKAFCAGGDIKDLANRAEIGFEDRVERLREKQRVALVLRECPKPTIARIGGPALGAGFSLALACDFRIASKSAKFGTAFARIAFSGDLGGTASLVRLVGPAKARELYFLADTLDAEQAARMGLVGEVVPDEELVTATMRLARRLADGPTVTYGYMKNNLLAAEREAFGELLDREARNQVHTAFTADHKEAVRAFVEKRTPKFEGR